MNPIKTAIKFTRCIFAIGCVVIFTLYFYLEDRVNNNKSSKDLLIKRLPDCSLRLNTRYVVEPQSSQESLCSHRSTLRGKGQKVISFSLFGDLVDGDDDWSWYTKGVEGNAELVPLHYGPDWTMRVYHNIPEEDKLRLDLISKIEEKFDFVDFCYIQHIHKFGNLTDILETIWRFLPLGDPLVDVFHSRDLDSRLSAREADAVNEFHNLSWPTFHLMRDNRNHRAKILAGLWGAKPSNNRELTECILQRLIEDGNKNASREFLSTKYDDQILLNDHLYPYINGSVLAHDSYHCGVFRLEKTVPFPSARRIESYNFVGAQMFGHVQPMMDVCPPPCRPKENQDWIFC